MQFGLNKKFHLAGAQQELEVLLGLPPEARIGTWVFEWYWKQPNVPHVAEFVAEIRKKSGGHVPTARTWFGFAAIHTCALAAAQAKTLDAVKMAKAMQGFKLPPEVALMPDAPSSAPDRASSSPISMSGMRNRKAPTIPRSVRGHRFVKGADVAERWKRPAASRSGRPDVWVSRAPLQLRRPELPGGAGAFTSNGCPWMVIRVARWRRPS